MIFFTKIECLIVQMPKVLTRNFKNKTAKSNLFYISRRHIDSAARVRILVTIAPHFFPGSGLDELPRYFPLAIPQEA